MKTKAPKTIKQAEESAEIVASIDDLLTQILLHLPIKSLSRFKIVSKHWQSLITNPRFLRRRNPNPNSAVGLILPADNIWGTLFDYVSFSPKKSTNPPFTKLNFPKEPSGVKVLHSCNGLLLCSSFQPHRGNTTHYYVYNPTTNQCFTLPKLDENATRVSGMSLAFDPAKSPHYKVVCVRLLHYVYYVQIYSPETGKWKVSGEAFEAYRERYNFKNGVYWNGAVHWVSTPYEDDTYSLYFDIDGHVLKEMPIPPTYRRNGRTTYYFGESCDHLHYIQICGSEIQFNVYEMRRDYSEWFVKYHVDLSLVAAANPRMISDSTSRGWIQCYINYAFSVFSVVRGEEEDDSFLVLQIPGQALRYNLAPKTFEKLHDFEGAKVKDVLKFLPGINGFQYIESLCSVASYKMKTRV